MKWRVDIPKAISGGVAQPLVRDLYGHAVEVHLVIDDYDRADVRAEVEQIAGKHGVQLTPIDE